VEEASGGAHSLGTVEDMLRSLNVGISLQGGHFPPEGNLVCDGEIVYWGL